MNQEEALNLLDELFCKNLTQRYCVLLKGNWGIGKSYLWTLFSEHLKKTGLKKIPISISLFGLSTLDELRDAVRFSKIKKEDINGIISGLNITRDVSNEIFKKLVGVNIDLLSLVSDVFDDKYIVCFDDLERTSISIKNVLGFIENCCKYNCLIISNENKISDSDEYNNFKEKVIDVEIELNEISVNTINTFLKDYAEFNQEERRTIFDFFVASESNNLRTLQKICNFIMEFRNKYPGINTDIIKACCAVVQNKIELKMKEFHDVLIKFNLPISVSGIIKDIDSFFEIHHSNSIMIREYINPKQETEFQKMISQFENYFYYDRESIELLIHCVKDIILRHDRDFFENWACVIRLVEWVAHCAKILEYDPDFIKDIVQHGLIIIKHFIEEADLQTLDSIKEFRVSGPIDPSRTDIAKQTYELIKGEASKKANLLFINLFREKEYSDCRPLILNHPEIINDNLYIFDLLDQKFCDEGYYDLLATIITNPRFYDCGTIGCRLKAILAKTSDPIIKQRINNLLLRLVR